LAHYFFLKKDFDPMKSTPLTQPAFTERSIPEYRTPELLINGRWRPGRSALRIEVCNPATEELLGDFSSASTEDLAETLAASEVGFAAWSQRSARERAEILERGVSRMLERLETIATWLTLEQGKTLAESRQEVQVAAEMIKWYAEESRRVYGRLASSRLVGATMEVRKYPVGPVLALSPWNYPVILTARKIGGALAAGCSVIVKAAEETPAAVAAMVDCLQAELPPGALQLVYGNPVEISETLIASPVIRKVSFTGSVGVGRTLARQCSEGFKRTTLELGGHAPVIVWADADLDRFVPMLVGHKFRNAGQACLAPTRFLVHQSIEREFCDRFAAETQVLKVGNGMSPVAQMGPMISARRKAAMAPLVADSLEHGADLVCGGAMDGQGHFHAPTVLRNVPRSARIMSEEPFGPLAPITGFNTLEEALAIANDNPYGLAAYLFTDSRRIAHQVTERLQVGAIAINNVIVSMPEAPFGGIKDSGIGSESGIEGMASFLETRTVHAAQ
jgi:acyl-CoA reductase-like NAD-dependent aldehyde dehydrogenase